MTTRETWLARHGVAIAVQTVIVVVAVATMRADVGHNSERLREFREDHARTVELANQTARTLERTAAVVDNLASKIGEMEQRLHRIEDGQRGRSLP